MFRTVISIVVGLGFVAFQNCFAQAVIAKEEKEGKEPKEATTTPSLVRIALEQRESSSLGTKRGLGYANGGFIELTEPSPESILIAMTGSTAAAGSACADAEGNINFELVQNFRIEAKPDVASVKLVLDAQLIGMLRANRAGAGVASIGAAQACIMVGDKHLIDANFSPKAHGNSGNLFINDRVGPTEITLPPGNYTLHQSFSIRCAHPRQCFDKNLVIASFGPPATRPPEWINILDPNREMIRQRDAGFRVSLRLQPVMKKP